MTEDLKKEGITFSGINSKQDRLSNKNIFKNKKFSDELDISMNENNRSVDIVVINNNKETSLRRTPLNINKTMSHQVDKSPNRPKSKTIATALQCEKCEETYQPQEFLEHLKFCQKSNLNNSSCQNSNRKNFNEGGTSNYFSKIFENNDNSGNLNDKYFSVPNVHENSDEFEFYNMKKSFQKSQNGPLPKRQNTEVINLLDGLTKEKTEIISQLKNVEEKLQKTQIDNQMIYNEKENLQANLQALLQELEKTKMQMVYSAEEKQQAENLLKKEIKVLIKKLIKTKGKLINQKNLSKLDCTTNTSLVNLSGFINFYNQNKENSTFGTKPAETQNTNPDSSFLNQSIQQVFSNSLFSLANKSYTRSKSRNTNPTNNYQKSGQDFRETYYTPNKNEGEAPLVHNNFLENKKLERERNHNLQLFKSKAAESTTTKPIKKMNRYNN